MNDVGKPAGTHTANNLDFIRFAAAMAVLVSHCYPIFGQPFDLLQHLTGWLTLGGVAVDIFFVVSGYLIAQSWQRNPSTIAFLRNRALRILPALYAFFLLSFLIAGPLLTELPLRTYFSNANITEALSQFGVFRIDDRLPGVFTHNVLPSVFNGSLWTIPLEVSCYLAALILGASGLFSGRWTTGAAAAITFGLYFYCANAMPIQPRILYVPLVQAVDVTAFFFAGSTLYFWLPKLPKLHGAYALIALAALLCLGGRRAPVVLHLILPFLIMSMALHPTKRLSKFGKHGDFSYGIYLYAFPVTQSVMHFIGPAITLPGLMALSIAGTALCAILSWRCVEHPALMLKRAGVRPARFEAAVQ